MRFGKICLGISENKSLRMDKEIQLEISNIKQPGPEVITLFHAQLSTKFQLLIKLRYRQMKKCIALSLSDVIFIKLINVKMPTIVGILTFMSRINFVHGKSFITSGPVC